MTLNYHKHYNEMRSITPKKTLKSFSASAPPRPDPARGAYNALPDPLVGWGGGYPLPIHLPLNSFGVSVSAILAPLVLGLSPSPQTVNPGAATGDIYCVNYTCALCATCMYFTARSRDVRAGVVSIARSQQALVRRVRRFL